MAGTRPNSPPGPWLETIIPKPGETNVDNHKIAKLIENIADLLEFNGANAFKIRAYQRAAQAIENLTEPLRAIYERGELQSIGGIGKGIAEKLEEWFETGKVGEFEELKSEIPETVLQVMGVPGVGPKKARLFFNQLGVKTLEELKKAASEGRLESLPGMGKKSQEKILKGIATHSESSSRFTLGDAHPPAREILARVSKAKGVKESAIAGSLRRCKETIGDVDILVSTSDPKAVMDEFFNTPNIRDTPAKGESKSSIVLENGLQVDLRVVPAESFGAALQYFTGSKDHNVRVRERAVKRGFKVNEYGVFKTGEDKPVAGRTEEDVYKALGLAWIAPEMREGLDEIELAEEGKLPDLIEESDIRAALHNHTTESDGSMTLRELADEAKRRGYSILAVTDHSASLGIANGLSEDRLRRQIEEIRELNDSMKGLTVLAGSEVEIKANGDIDYSESLLEQLDVVVASVHTSQDQPREKITDRVRKALSNPYVHILGHPSGRLIGRRPPMDLDWERVFQTAAEHNKYLEINAHYWRLDLNGNRIREASRHGVRFSVNTDTHKSVNFDNLQYGVGTARRGRLTAADVINTLSLKDLRKALKRARGQ